MNRPVDFHRHGVGDFKFPDPELLSPDAETNLGPEYPKDGLAVAKLLADGGVVPESGHFRKSDPQAAVTNDMPLDCTQSVVSQLRTRLRAGIGSQAILNIACRNAKTFL